MKQTLAKGVMEDVIKQVLAKAPELAALCFIVSSFLKYQKERDTFIRDLHSEHIEARKESTIAIKENTISNRDVSEAVRELRYVVRDANKNKDE